MKKLKYKTLKEVLTAYTSGELSRDNKLQIDYIGVSLYDQKTKKVIFSHDLGIILEEALEILDMPFE